MCVCSGDFIMEYVGEVLDQRQFQDRIKQTEVDRQKHFYFMTIRNGKVIDASRKGNLSRFMNHSCNPNCETQKWMVNGQLRVGLFAQKPVRAGSELTFDYKFVRFGQVAQQCFCGDPNCKGTIGVEPKNSNEFSIITSDSESNSDDLDSIVDAESTSVEQIPKIVKGLLQSEGASHTAALLDALLKSQSQKCFNQFIHFHGLKVMASLSLSKELNEPFLKVLLELPLSNQRQIEDTGLMQMVKSLEDSELKAKVLTKWESLSTEYHIPRITSTPDLKSIGLNEADDPFTLDVPEQFKLQRTQYSSIPSKSHSARAASTRKRSHSPRGREQSSPFKSSMKSQSSWKTATTPDGQVYYYNEATRETCWDPPMEMASPSPPSTARPTFEQVKPFKFTIISL